MVPSPLYAASVLLLTGQAWLTLQYRRSLHAPCMIFVQAHATGLAVLGHAQACSSLAAGSGAEGGGGAGAACLPARVLMVQGPPGQ